MRWRRAPACPVPRHGGCVASERFPIPTASLRVGWPIGSWRSKPGNRGGLNIALEPRPLAQGLKALHRHRKVLERLPVNRQPPCRRRIGCRCSGPGWPRRPWRAPVRRQPVGRAWQGLTRSVSTSKVWHDSFLAPRPGGRPCVVGRCRPSRPLRGPSSGSSRHGVFRNGALCGDGDSLCVGETPDPTAWVEVRLADFDAPELRQPGGEQARTRLRQLTLGQRVDCRAERGRSGRVIVYDRVIALCRLQGRPLGDRLRAAGGREGGA
jgi:hypothetical protein